MRKIISFVHISLDGFVAGPNGEMNWITLDQELFDFVGKRIGTGNAALYGRVTFDMMEAYWPTAAEKPNASKHDKEHSAWYKTVQKIVLSRTMQDNGRADITIINGDLTTQIEEIKTSSGPDILLFGSPSATHALMELDLIDGYWLFVNPIILGEGIPLFKNIQHITPLTLVSIHPFACGVVELNYVVKEKA